MQYKGMSRNIATVTYRVHATITQSRDRKKSAFGDLFSSKTVEPFSKNISVFEMLYFREYLIIFLFNNIY